jgi:hypothetical protein
MYSVFDLIAPTFQRLTYSSMQDKSFPSSDSLSSSASLIHSSLHSHDDLIPSFCSYQSYDDICIVTSDNHPSSLSYPNLTLLSTVPKNRTVSSSSSSSTRIPWRVTTAVSIQTTTSTEWVTSTLSTYNMTDPVHESSSIELIRTPLTKNILSKLTWKNLWMFLVPIASGVIFCMILALLGYVKYRRKDVGVYEVEEAQRFRPLIVQLSPSPGEHQHDTQHTTTAVQATVPLTSTGTISSSMTTGTNPVSKASPNKSHSKRRRKKSPRTSTDEQREFYI